MREIASIVLLKTRTNFVMNTMLTIVQSAATGRKINAAILIVNFVPTDQRRKTMIVEIFAPYKCKRCDEECSCDGLEDIQKPIPQEPEEVVDIYILEGAPSSVEIPANLLGDSKYIRFHAPSSVNTNDAKITLYGVK